MACIARRPRCGLETSDAVPKPLTTVAAAVALVTAIIGVIMAVGGAIGAITVTGGTIFVSGVAIVGAAGGGAISAAAVAIALLIVIGIFASDRCTAGPGLPECVAGVVDNVVGSFDTALDELLPFSAMHDRIDVVAKSRFWDAIEDGNAFVFCTVEESPRRSEVLRCYFYDPRVCAAGRGAVYGGVAGAVAGVIAGALIAAAIGCATIIFCIFALIAAALVAAAAVIIGALVGGQIGKETSTDASPTAGTGETLARGHLVTVRGSMKRREHDDSANVIYWATAAQFHGSSASSSSPFSYCDIDEELSVDGCVAPPPSIR